MVLIIPIVNIVIWIIAVTSPQTNPTFKNYLLAQLVLVVAVVIMFIMFMGAIMHYLEGFYVI